MLVTMIDRGSQRGAFVGARAPFWTSSGVLSELLREGAYRCCPQALGQETCLYDRYLCVDLTVFSTVNYYTPAQLSLCKEQNTISNIIGDVCRSSR